MTALTRWIIQHARWVVLCITCLSLVAGYFSLRLYENLRPDLEQLLPSNARSVVDLKEINSRLPSSSNLAVLIFSKHPDASRTFVDDLASQLNSNYGLISRVDYRISNEIRFFEKRKPLFIGLGDLKKAYRYVQDRLTYEQELTNPLNVFSGVELKEPTLDLKGIRQKYSKPVENFLRFKDGYYANPDETVRVLLVYMRGNSSELGKAKLFQKEIVETIKKLDPKKYAPDMEIHYTGDIENILEEQASLLSDLELAAVLVFVLESVVLLVFYQNVLCTLALVFSLLMGAFWTFGLTYFIEGYLNANSAFLGSIVLGNGINFGIIHLARYLEYRRQGMHHPFALMAASQNTKSATILAALAAALSYGALILTPFRGFRQFGLIGFMGMVLCWVSAYTVQPALLTLFVGRKPSEAFHKTKNRMSSLLARVDSLHYKVIAVGTVLLTGFFIQAISGYRGNLIETDTLKLRDKRSMAHGSGFYTKYLDEVFGRYISPLVILPRTYGDSVRIRSRLNDVLEHGNIAKNGHKMIARIYSEDDFVPKDQNEKIGVLKKISELLPRRLFGNLSQLDRRRVRTFLQPEAFHPFAAKDLPPGIRERFRENDNSVGKIILVEPVLDSSVINDGDNETILMNSLRGVVDSVSPGTPIAGQIPLTVDMYQAVRKEGPRSTTVAFLAVFLLAIVIFRHFKTITLAVSALLLGICWFFGLMASFDLKINFLNFIALPITFGIGVDYGVNIFQRYRQEGSGSIVQVIRNTAGAVTLASLTTCIGYGSLLLAGSQAFVSFGRIAILGEVCCLTAAIVSLPSFLIWMSRGREKVDVDKPRPLAVSGKSH